MMFLRSKKAQLNDVTYIIIIFGILFLVAIALPYIQRDVISGGDYGTGYNSTITYNNPNVINQSSADINSSTSIISLGTVIISIVKMLFWFYGTLPLALEMFFIFLKIVGWILIYRLIRSGGG